MRPFANVRGGPRQQTEADYLREIAAEEKAGKPALGHSLDLHCGHCTAGHRLPSRWRIVKGDQWWDTTMVADCECGQQLAGDVADEWKAHVREAVPTDPQGRRVA